MFNRILRNKEVRIRIAKTDENDTAPVAMEAPLVDPETIVPMIKDVIKTAAIAVGSVIVLSIVAGTVGDVIVEKTKQNNDNPYMD